MCTDTDIQHQADLRRDGLILKWKRQAKAARSAGRRRKLYIITLHPDVLDHAEFRHANPGYTYAMPCVYVGLTIHEPGDRFQQHRAGYRSSKYPRRYGVELALELLDGFDPCGLVDEEKEQALAEWLRSQGYGVWQN